MGSNILIQTIYTFMMMIVSNLVLMKKSQFLDSRQHYGSFVCSTMKIEERVTLTNIVFIRKSILCSSKMAMHLADILVKNQFTTILFVFKKICLDVVGYDDNRLPVLEDLDFNILFLEFFYIGEIDEYFSNYHFRIPTVADQTPQTLTTSSILHEEYSAIIRNRFIRNADNKKRMALAMIMSNGRYHQISMNKLQVLDDYVRSKNLMSDFFKFLIKRFHNSTVA